MKQTFLENRERYRSVLGGDLGYVPPMEWDRKVGFGEVVNPDGGIPRARPPASLYEIARFAGAYRQTQNEPYAEQAKQYYLAWIRKNFQEDPEGWRKHGNDVAHGLYGWLGTLHLLLPSPAFDEETVAAIIEAARVQLAYLYENIWPENLWINLRNTYATSLLSNGLRLAFLPEASAWLQRAAHIMSDAVQRQINPDGSHQEATPHYHWCTAGDLLSAFRKARLVPELKMNLPAEKIASLYDYLVAATRPTGWISSLHDGDYDDPAAVRGNGIADALEERAAFRRSLDLPEVPLPTVQIFPDAGQVYLRDRWTNDATYLTFDATRFGGYHQHPSRNSITLQAFGRLLLADPGRFSYQQNAWGAYGWSTRAHSTLNVNGWNQSVWGSPAVRHRSAPGYDLVEGAYSGGYWQRPSIVDWEWQNEPAAGFLAEHHRLLLWIRHRAILVIDSLLCPKQEGQIPMVESVWQFSESEVRLDAERRRALTAHPDANLLLLFPLQPDGTELSVHAGETEPWRGWVPRVFDRKFVPAPQVVQHVESQAGRDADFATVLLPYRGTESPPVEAAALADPEKTRRDFFHRGHGHVQLRWADGSTDDIWWRRRLETALDEQDDFVTDGSLVHLQRDTAGRLVQGLVVDGTFISPHETGRRRTAGTFWFGAATPGIEAGKA